MDLAEIRKKAQKERQGTGGVTTPPAELPEEIVLESIESAQADEEERSGISDDLFQEPVESRFARIVEAAPDNFDPLAVLIAGRTVLHEDEARPDQTGIAAYSSGEDFQEFLCFRVSSEIYAINIMAIKEIIKPREATDIPRAPGFVSGILSLRGIIIPIFDMRLRLGLPEGEKSVRQRIIVVKKGEEFIGLVVDEVTQVVRIASASVEKPPAVLDGIDRDFVGGIGRYNGQMLILLNQEKILDISLGQGGERGRV
jgi:purine-binding chemotaxis protein CheW